MKQKGKGKPAMMAATIEMTMMVAGELHVFEKMFSLLQFCEAS